MSINNVNFKSFYKKISNKKILLVIFVLMFFVFLGANKYYSQDVPFTCDKFKGEKELCEFVVIHFDTASRNTTNVYHIEEYTDGNYSNAWLIYMNMPGTFRHPDTNITYNEMRFIFDKEIRSFSLYGYFLDEVNMG